VTKPILLDFPDHIETARLIIRAPRPGDGPAMNAAILETLDNLRPWMPWVQVTPTVEDSEEYVRSAAARFLKREELPMTFWRKSDGLFVGGVGLHRIDWTARRFEIGYWVRASLEGQGYITEAVNGITRFAFDQLGAQRVEIRCDSRNQRSAAVARRAGYTLDGCLRHDDWAHNGTLRDTLVFSKIREEE
jgi:RimJ/RimL family protein N-acetyltransferase